MFGEQFTGENAHTCKVTTAMILNNLRILKRLNRGDNYYEEYLKHYAREGEKFFDQYHLAIHYVQFAKPKRILEIGVRTGLSICNMLSAYTDYSCIEKIVLIDIWADGFASPEIVKMNLRAMNFPDSIPIKFWKEDSKTAIPQLEEKFDYVLVDGNHAKEAAREDLKNAARLVAKDGLIVFDDITEHGCNLQDVWDEFKVAHDHLFDFHENHKGKGVGWGVKK